MSVLLLLRKKSFTFFLSPAPRAWYPALRSISMMVAQARAAQVRLANLVDEIPDEISILLIPLYRSVSGSSAMNWSR